MASVRKGSLTAPRSRSKHLKPEGKRGYAKQERREGKKFIQKQQSELSIVSVDYHRNGIGGCPFKVVLFRDSENNNRLMVATLFYDGNKEDDLSQEYACVFDVGLLAEENARFFENSWRGDRYAHRLTPMIKEWDKQKEREPEVEFQMEA